MALCLDESYFPAPPTRLADWTHVQKVRPSAYYGSVGFGCNPSPDLIRPYNVAGLPACPRRASNLDPLTEVDECRSRTGCPNQKDRRDTWFNRNFIPDEPAPERSRTNCRGFCASLLRSFTPPSLQASSEIRSFPLQQWRKRNSSLATCFFVSRILEKVQRADSLPFVQRCYFNSAGSRRNCYASVRGTRTDRSDRV